MNDTGCLGLVHWDDPGGWYGEGTVPKSRKGPALGRNTGRKQVLRESDKGINLGQVDFLPSVESHLEDEECGQIGEVTA